MKYFDVNKFLLGVHRVDRAAAERAPSPLQLRSLKKNFKTKKISTPACYVEIITAPKRC